MFSSRTRSPRGTPSARPWLRTGLVVIGIASIGCQAEHAGMTLPSGKYMYDDVQYFPHGPSFPWANTQAATQRAQMREMGMNVSEPGAAGQAGPSGGPAMGVPAPPMPGGSPALPGAPGAIITPDGGPGAAGVPAPPAEGNMPVQAPPESAPPGAPQ